MGRTSRRPYGDYILLAASLIWGTAFYFQSVAMDVMGPYTFVTVRGILATTALGFILVIRSRFMPSKTLFKLGTKRGYTLAVFGGLILAFAMITQQVGIVGTTTGKAGFITTLYIIFVPLIGVFFKQRYPLKTWLALGLGLVGFFYLSTEGTLTSINAYDALILLTAFAYGAQIYLIDQLKTSIDSMMFSFVQFGVATLVSIVPTLWLEGIDISFLVSVDAVIALLYVGIVSSVIAYTLQVVGQKRSSSAPVASLMMSLEAIFATLAGVLWLNEIISSIQAFGMVLIFLAILLSQISLRFLKELLLKRKQS
jgi:drug/metabolite transporter (DMT)-like permease